MSESDLGDKLVKAAIVVAIVGNTITIRNGFKDVTDNIEKLKSTLIEYRLQERDVLENRDLPEKFYEIDGNRVYLEIDGKPVEQYFQGR